MKRLYPLSFGRRALVLACACVSLLLVMACGEPSGAGIASTPPDTTGPPPGDSTDPPETVAPDAGTTECEPSANGLIPAYCPCQENIDCESGYCIESGQGKMCTETCIADCPDGWSCELVGGLGSDSLFLCVPKHPNLCRPCLSDEECKSPFLDNVERCVDYGDIGNYCGINCAPEAGSEPCPSGFQCNLMDTVDGSTSMQCVATEGQCPCSAQAVQQQAKTTCMASTDVGSCPGVLQCTEEGPASCEPAPVPEICDGLDNDCDGAVDEVCAPVLRGHLMGDGFSLSSDNGQFFMQQTLGAPRMVGTSQNDTFVLTPGLPNGGK